MGLLRIVMVRGNGDLEPAVNDGTEFVEELTRESRGTFRVKLRYPRDFSIVDRLANASFTDVDVEVISPLEIVVHVSQASRDVPGGAPFDGGFTLRWGEALVRPAVRLRNDAADEYALRSKSVIRGESATEKMRCDLCRVEVEVSVAENWTCTGGRIRCAKCSRAIWYTTEWKTVDRRSERQESDLTWLSDHGEDAASLRALVEAVDAAYDVHKGGGGLGIPPDSRAKFVNKLSATVPIEDEPCDVCGMTETSTRLICTACDKSDHVCTDGMKDPGEEEKEDVPLGGLSHEDAHFVLSGIETAREMLSAGQAWPDDARKVERYLKGLLK